jgi:serine/threonine-protein kinase PknG
VAELAAADHAAARRSFASVYAELPGELAPKLALGLACESAGDADEAVRWYEIVSRTDPSITSASFGLGRCRLALGDRAGAIGAYERVPESSSGHLDAQTARIRCLNLSNGNAEPTFDDILAAGAILEDLPIDASHRDRLTVDLLETALRLTLAGSEPHDGRRMLVGHRLVEHDLRLGLERSYRSLARHAASRAELIRLIERANHARPRTWT